MVTLDDPEIDPGIYARRWRTLVVLCLSLMIVMVGNISVNVALPSLARDLDASSSQLQWIVDAYALVFAGLLFTAGTLGDRFGRRGALQGGLVLFLLAAGAAAMAPTAGVLIAARAVMGAAAAFVMPSTLSILTNVFPAEERARAISVWAGIAAGGAAIGPVGSGLLLQHFWWGSVFLVNVPLIVVALVAGRWLVPTSRDPQEHPLDVPGALLSVLGVGALVYGIIEGPGQGWGSSRTLVAFGAAAALLALFGLRERTARHPMLDLALFRDRRFSVASTGIGLTFFAMFGTFFLVTQYLQLVLGRSPLAAGVLLLPTSLLIMVVSPQVPKLVVRFGPARVVPVGLSLLATGLVLLSTLGADTPAWAVVLAVVPMATGMAMTGPPLTALLMSSVPAGRAGVGSAMNDTSRELGGALGVAVLGSLVTTQFSSSLRPVVAGLPASARAAAESGLAGALEVAGRQSGPTGEALADAARAAFVNGFGLAALVGVGLLLAAAAAAFILLPRGAAPAIDQAAPPAVAPTAGPAVGDRELVPAAAPTVGVGLATDDAA